MSDEPQPKSHRPQLYRAIRSANDYTLKDWQQSRQQREAPVSPAVHDAAEFLPRKAGGVAPVVSLAQASQWPRPCEAVLQAQGIHKSYRKGSIVVPVLRGVDLSVREGELLAIVGQSGSGKSTLLHLLGTLDAPDAGEIHFEGHRVDDLPAAGRDVLRNKYFGMIFQFYHLLPELTTLENALAPTMISRGVWNYWRNRRQLRQRATELLELVGLGHRLHHKPRELSGGEMQRTAIARALVQGPRVLLADEPTGNLDRRTGEDVMQILHRLNRDQNLTIVMVTHDWRIAEQADRTVELVEGQMQPHQPATHGVG